MKKRLTVLALAFAMVLTMSASVFAEDTQPMNVALTKQLKIAEGIPVPSEAFTFAVTPAKAGNPYASDDAYESNAQKYPTVKFADISFSDSDRGTTTKDTLVKESTVDVASLSFPHAGLYVYEIKENEGALKDSGMTYDKAKVYYLKVFVKNGANGPYVANTEVTDGTNKKNADPNAEEPGENKPVPEDKEATGEFRFENTYAKMITEHKEPTNPNPDDPDTPYDPENPDPINKGELTTDKTGAFELDKFVLGEYGNQQKDFEFTVSVELPTVGVPEGFDPKAEGNYTGTWGTDNKVTLKHGETFSIKQLPMGTKVTVAEPNPGEGYHANWTTSEEDALTVIVGEDGAYAICRNGFNDSEVTPTGIIINNLPYVLLIGLALGGIVLFSRKRRYE